MMQLIRRAVLAALVAAWGVACSSGGHHLSAGPLDASGDPSTQCVPQPTDQPITFGLNVVKNTGPDAVQIRGVRLLQPTNMRLVHAKVLILSADQRSLVGIWAAYPPDAAQLHKYGISWSGVHDANNTSVPPGGTANIVLELSRTAPHKEGTAQATEIDYTSDGKSYRATTNTAIRLASATQC